MEVWFSPVEKAASQYQSLLLWPHTSPPVGRGSLQGKREPIAKPWRLSQFQQQIDQVWIPQAGPLESGKSTQLK